MTEDDDLKLHPLNRGVRDNHYCGPAAISFLTGLNTSDAARLIRQRTHERCVRGVSAENLVWIMRCWCGLRVRPANSYEHLQTRERPTLAAWLRESKASRSAGRVWLIVAGNHFQLVTGRRYACGRIGEIVSIRDKRVQRRARVKSVYEVTKPKPMPRRR